MVELTAGFGPPFFLGEEAVLSLEHWESYYRGGALASCPMGPESGYTLELREVWLQFFGELPDGARILDVGTGNGVIALLAKEAGVARARRFDIHGTDLARIDPKRNVPNGVGLFEGIEFHPGVATERLPFDTASFHAVSGQYALEYTDVGAALREVHRVLRGGGRAQFVIHHADSVIVQNAKTSRDHVDLVLNETKILRKLRRHVETERRSPVAARRTAQELAATRGRLEAAARASPNSLTLAVTLDAVAKLLEARASLSSARIDREIDGFEATVRASSRRLDDLIRSAQSAEAMSALRASALETGFARCEFAPQFHALDKLVGWRMNLAKDGAVQAAERVAT